MASFNGEHLFGDVFLLSDRPLCAFFHPGNDLNASLCHDMKMFFQLEGSIEQGCIIERRGFTRLSFSADHLRSLSKEVAIYVFVFVGVFLCPNVLC